MEHPLSKLPMEILEQVLKHLPEGTSVFMLVAYECPEHGCTHTGAATNIEKGQLVELLGAWLEQRRQEPVSGGSRVVN